MKKVLDFIKSNLIIAKWTFWYFFVLWLILRLVFKFDMFSGHYWWKFFHSTLHGFGGFVFGLLVYTAIPIYIATTSIIYRKKELVITIPFVDKIAEYLSKFFPKKETVEKTEEPVAETEPEQKSPDIPSDVPPELRVPYMRAKNHMSLTGSISVYNKSENKTNQNTPESIMASDTNESPIPLPTDFDISENIEQNDSPIPMFHDINFDEPEPEPEKLENNTTKYLTEKHIEFETYKDFTSTKKYVIYEHNDGDFWIMDDNAWFANGKQKDSPVADLISIAKQNGLIPVIYLQSQNIMDIEATTDKFENLGIHVIKSLDELDF